MTPSLTLGLVGAWFVAGMARIVCTSRLAEYRTDDPAPGRAMAINRQARAERLDVANYDQRGRRLLPWYRVINTTYWTLAVSLLCWAIFHG